MKKTQPTIHRLLFLCTGNYYRSRFAEALFNTLAGAKGLNWSADSRALAIELGVHNVGPISEYALVGLQARGISPDMPIRFPAQVQERDLQQADLVIALKEAEHRAYLEERYPRWPDRVEYWHIHDLNVASAEEALAELDDQVRKLIVRLSNNGGPST